MKTKFVSFILTVLMLAVPVLAVGNKISITTKLLPLPPEPNPFGQKQPIFGDADGYFTFDGQPAVIISGSIHYPRVPRPYWRDRIQKAKAMGFNCIGTYLFWNAHEKKPGEFDFSGNLDVAEFVKTCQEEGMWVIVRPGPYICSEWDFGGMPAWLLKEPDMQVRTNDPRFLAATERYMKAVGEQLKDLQVTQGGPIIQVQVENEYGQFGRPGNEEDMAYNRAIYDQMVAAGFDTMFIRCDWPNKSTIGTAHIDGVYTTMNFGGSAEEAFTFFEKEYPGMPKMCGEYWVGWFDHWGSKHHTKALAPFIKEIDWMLANKVSFNVYMLHGGTNWGFTSGANWSSGQYSADTTSYDYDSPMDETGRLTAKFDTFKNAISKYLPADYVLPGPPKQIKRIEIPEFELNQQAGFEQLRKEPYKFEKPTYLEALDQTQGLAIYSTSVSIDKAGKYPIEFSALKDRAIIIVNGQRVATLDRRKKETSASIQLPAGEVQLDILLENMGHLNYSRELMTDRKGLGDVTLDGKEVLNWQIYTFLLELDDIAGLKFSDTPVKETPLPVFYRGQFTVEDVGDTYLNMTGWGKCMVWVNGINLGRFWDIGPQYGLYMPGCWMKEGANEVIVMDIEPTGHQTINGVTEQIYGLKMDKNLRYNRKPGETIQLEKSQLIAEGKFENGDHAQIVDFGKTISARYVCIESLSSYSDDNNAAIAEIHLMDADGKSLDRNGWQVIYADSEEIVAEPAGADNILDEQPVTFWLTQYQDGNPPHPHQVVIDLGEVKELKTLRYLPRNGANPGKIKDYKIYADKKLFKGLGSSESADAKPVNTIFKPGELWLDVDGNAINAHGGGLLFHEGTYYWYGEMKSGKTYLPDCNKSWGGTRVDVTGISCYSSRDLVNWKFEGKALDAANDDKDHALHTSMVVERPKAVYNAKTGKFVLWFHSDSMDYAKAACGVAVSDSPTGRFTFLKSFRPNAGQWPIGYEAVQEDKNKIFYKQYEDGQMSRDMTVFVDDDGKGYLFYASEDNGTMHIAELSDDYLSTTGRYKRVFLGRSMEAPAVFKREGKYYLIASGCTGWDPNPARSAVADNIWGPWKELGNPCRGENADTTYFSQSTYVLPVHGKKDTYIFIGDRWKKNNLPDSRYIWLPIEFDDQDRPILKWRDQWDISSL